MSGRTLGSAAAAASIFMAVVVPAFGDTINMGSGMRMLERPGSGREVPQGPLRDLGRLGVQTRVMLEKVPESMLQLSTPQRGGVYFGRNPSSQRRGIQPTGAYFVETHFTGHDEMSCLIRSTDRLDLQRVLNNGFTFVKAEIKELGPDLALPRIEGRPGVVRTMDRAGNVTTDMSKVVSLEVSRPNGRYQIPMRTNYFCHMAYRLEVTLSGPSRVDPITGEQYGPPRQVN